MQDRRYDLLMCPTCGSSPEPNSDLCPGCGRRSRTPSGCVDLLTAQQLAEANAFADRYTALRHLEGWADSEGREDPFASKSIMWRHRVDVVTRAARYLNSTAKASVRPIVLDVGAGGGWAARLVPYGDVISLDLIEFPSAASLCVRGDMREMPVRNSSIDGLLFAASAHYAPIDQVVSEAGRVLRKGGIAVFVDSPIYATDEARLAARERSAEYYRRMGFPELIDRYHPLAEGNLRQVLKAHGLRIDRFEVSSLRTLWRRIIGRSPGTIVVAAKVVNLNT